MFGKKNKAPIEYDPLEKMPAVKRSICTGERVAGFIDIKSRQFQDYMLVRNEAELEAFCSRVGVDRSDIKEIV